MQLLYKYAVPKPREECSKAEQLTVSFAAGYIAGVFCAVVSHPADNLVSKLNAQKGSTAGDIIKQMGWYALFTRGLGLRIIMIGTLTGLQVRRCGVDCVALYYMLVVVSRVVGLRIIMIGTLTGLQVRQGTDCVCLHCGVLEA